MNISNVFIWLKYRKKKEKTFLNEFFGNARMFS